MIDADRRLLYSKAEAARQLSISRRSIDYLIAGGQLRTRRIGSRVLVAHAALIAFSKGDHCGVMAIHTGQGSQAEVPETQ